VGNAAELEHTVTDVTILGQMGRGGVFAIWQHQLIHGAAPGKFRVELPTELTRATSAGISAFNYGWVNVFHER